MAGREQRELPKIFDGTYAEGRGFLTSMQLYFTRNKVHIRSVRVIIALNYIRGERVDSWAVSKTTWLDTVSDDPDLLQGHDVWHVFKEDFLREFVYPKERAKARKEIEEIKMEGEKLDAHIQNFRELARKAQYDLNAPFAIHLFLQGLPADLVRCTFGRDKLTTFEDWVDSIHKYHLKYCFIQTVLNRPPISNEEVPVLRQALVEAVRDSITMDDNLLQRALTLTEEDKIRYKQEGRCFHCGLHRHISRIFPQKGDSASQPYTNEKRETQRSPTSAKLIFRSLPIEERRIYLERWKDDPWVIRFRNETSSPTSTPRAGVILI